MTEPEIENLLAEADRRLNTPLAYGPMVDRESVRYLIIALRTLRAENEEIRKTAAICDDNVSNLIAQRDKLKVQLAEAEEWIPMYVEYRKLKDAEIAELKARLAKASIALTACLNAMEMQEKRERQVFHINQSTARHIWTQAKEAARCALKD